MIQKFPLPSHKYLIIKKLDKIPLPVIDRIEIFLEMVIKIFRVNREAVDYPPIPLHTTDNKIIITFNTF